MAFMTWHRFFRSVFIVENVYNVYRLVEYGLTEKAFSLLSSLRFPLTYNKGLKQDIANYFLACIDLI